MNATRRIKRQWKRAERVKIGTADWGDIEGNFVPANRRDRRRGILGWVTTDAGIIHEVRSQTR